MGRHWFYFSGSRISEQVVREIRVLLEPISITLDNLEFKIFPLLSSAWKSTKAEGETSISVYSAPDVKTRSQICRFFERNGQSMLVASQMLHKIVHYLISRDNSAIISHGNITHLCRPCQESLEVSINRAKTVTQPRYEQLSRRHCYSNHLALKSKYSELPFRVAAQPFLIKRSSSLAHDPTIPTLSPRTADEFFIN